MAERNAREQSFANDPRVAIRDHLNRVSRPDTDSISAVANVIRGSYHGYLGKRDAFGVCIDLACQFSTPTTFLAEMFDINHDVLPAHWKENPEITRTVLSMCGYIELGFLKAQQVSLSHTGFEAHVDERIEEVSQFVAQLQQM